MNKNAISQLYFKPISALKNLSKIPVNYPLVIVFLNGAVGVVGLLLLDQKIDYSEINSKSGFNFSQIITTIGFLNIVLVQLGGFIFQCVLTYMLAFIFNCKHDFNFYLKLIGLSYLGFLLTSILTVAFNTFFIPDMIRATDINILIENSFGHKILSKMGEFIVLSLIAFGLFYHEKFSIIKSLLISSAPSFLLLLFNQFFINLL